MEDTIIVNGVKMTMKEYKAYCAKKNLLKNPQSKKKAVVKEISAVALQIEAMLKQMSVLKSVQVYRNHAYRSWGTIANEILAYHGIRKPMAEYCVRFGELNSLLLEIQKMAKRNEKAAYQYVDKMAWKLDDMKTNITEIMKAVAESEVCVRFKSHEAINGKGKQLGLQTIIDKCYATISQIEATINDLKKIADEGTDPFHYGDHMSARARARCWA
jgi:chromatin segregation and condensation protein Rec8/ScpA/Scc1 (kleisin family)